MPSGFARPVGQKAGRPRTCLCRDSVLTSVFPRDDQIVSAAYARAWIAVASMSRAKRCRA